jgi:hypothetical protein
VLPVRYEQLVVAPEVQFQRMFHFLDIPYASWLSNIVAPSSIRKHAAPEVDPEVRRICDELTVRFDRVLEIER